MLRDNVGDVVTTDLFGPAGNNALLSECGTYRYELSRTWDWDSQLPVVGWVMLNPSTADATVDDPTIRRCMRFARRWGYGGIVVRNLFALRATNPRELRHHPNPVGPDNHLYLLSAVHDAFTVCAWGSHPLAIEPGAQLVTKLTATCVDVRCLGTTKNGHPRHPLYVRGDAEPVAYKPAAVTS